MFQKTKLIFNPASGQGLPVPFLSRYHYGVKQYNFGFLGKPDKVLDMIQHELQQAGITADPVLCDSSEYAEALARASVGEKYDCVIAAGGDGTVNAVINGLAGSQTCLGLLPTGSMNVFANQMDIPTSLRDACRTIARGRIREVDLGEVNGRFFSCMAGIGFDAYVIRRTDFFGLKRLVGVIAYGLSAASGSFSYPFARIRFKTETGSEFSGHTVIVGNVKYYGGDKILLPDADWADGKLDVIVFKRKSPVALLAYGLRLLIGRGKPQPHADYLQVRELQVIKPLKQHVHVDGEYYGKMQTRIRVVPHALRVVA